MKTFLSIGSGPGIGTATAERFAQEGFRIVLTSRDQVKLHQRAQQLEGKGFAVETKTIDAGDLGSVVAAIQETQSEFGGIHVLHFNSASMRATTIEMQPIDTFVTDLTINIGAAFVAIQAASREMLARGDGTILLTGGAFAINPHPNYLSLSIGKAGIRSLTHGLFESFKERGVHIALVNVATIVSPDSAESRGVAQAFWELYAQPRSEWKAEMTFPTT